MISDFINVANIENDEQCYHSTEELWEWIEDRKRKQNVSIKRITLGKCTPWFYDQQTGEIRNLTRSFFQIAGIRAEYPNKEIVEQPIIIQKEIGFLGIICKRINGIWHFLMQAKIEPGNINYVQISPTIQATKSNFTRKHGGKEPAYLKYFIEMKGGDILVDQIQSEQSSRFFGKRNRNVILKIEEDLEETDNHRWMTLKQIKDFMRYDNLINMDTRTVLSCMPYIFVSEGLYGYSDSYVQSINSIDRKTIVEAYLRINNYKMFSAPKINIIPLDRLKTWDIHDDEIVSRKGYPFKVIYCGLEIEGREVTYWNQPLFAAEGKATFGLICSNENNSIEVLVQLLPEIGCFDAIELGPSIQEEFGRESVRDEVSILFFKSINERNTVIDVTLSEEGGRFYHEQNRNVIVFMDKKNVKYDRTKYVWASVGTLNFLTQINNCLNIQLRNLLMLLSMYNEGGK